MSFILAVDQGTTGTTALLIDHSGDIIHRAYADLPQHYPQPGWVEHDPDHVWQTVESTVRKLVSQGFDPRQIQAIGITNQRETAVAWHRGTGEAFGNAIVWQCRRTTPICERWVAHRETVQRKTGLVLDPYFSATKWLWMLENRPQVAQAAEVGELAFGTIDSWLLWKLTGGRAHATDQTNASRTLLLNLSTLSWDPDLVALAQVPLDALPSVYPSAHPFAETEGLDFLPDGILISGIAGDQQAALFGQRCIKPGMAKNTYGTGCFLMMHTGHEMVLSQHGLLTTLACSATGEPEYALEGSVFVAGAAVQWLRDELDLISSAAETETLARQVPDTAGVTMVPAFTGLGAPYWVPEARGAILGLTRGTSKAHLARATLEAIAHQSTDVVDAMTADAGRPLEELRVDGGASANGFLMQFQADMIVCPVNRPKAIETTALGAAFLAGLQVGFWTPEDLERCRQVDTIFHPRMPQQECIQKRAVWKAAVQRVI